MEIVAEGGKIPRAATIGSFHSPIAWLLLVMVVGHVGIALWHHFVKKGRCAAAHRLTGNRPAHWDHGAALASGCLPASCHGRNARPRQSDRVFVGTGPFEARLQLPGIDAARPICNRGSSHPERPP
jgi:hypothetical protein